LHITPATSDLDEARRWFRNLRPMGVEGLVVKGEATPYRPGKLDWLKVKNRQTTEVVVGGVIGCLRAPEPVVPGRMLVRTMRGGIALLSLRDGRGVTVASLACR